MELQRETNRFWMKDDDGNMVAEVVFPEVEVGRVNIAHTEVDSSLQGQGIAGKLMEEVAKTLREDGRKAEPTCTYAKQWFSKHPEYNDVLK